MKYKFIGKHKVNIGELGNIEPGQIFEVNNKEMKHLFTAELFEVVKAKKHVKKEKDGE